MFYSAPGLTVLKSVHRLAFKKEQEDGVKMPRFQISSKYEFTPCGVVVCLGFEVLGFFLLSSFMRVFIASVLS